MKKISFILVIAITLLYSCTCQQQLHHLKSKCPQLLVTDTITKLVPVPVISFDSFFVLTRPCDTCFPIVYRHDTIFQKGKNFYIDHWQKGDTIYYKGDCKPDTIEIKVADDKLKYVPTDWKSELLKNIKWIAIALLGLAIIVVVLIAILKK